MAAGDRLSDADRVLIDASIREAEQLCRHEFSVYVGPVDGDSRSFATSLHNSLVAPSHSVMILVDPAARVVEVVTGGAVRPWLTDEEAEQAVVVMKDRFAQGDLVGGLRQGIARMAILGRRD